MSYRKDLRNNTYKYEDLIDYGYDKNDASVIVEDAVLDVLDKIENEVNDILDSLQLIEGLSEIDAVKEMLKDLSNKLY